MKNNKKSMLLRFSDICFKYQPLDDNSDDDMITKVIDSCIIDSVFDGSAPSGDSVLTEYEKQAIYDLLVLFKMYINERIQILKAGLQDGLEKTTDNS